LNHQLFHAKKFANHGVKNRQTLKSLI